MRRISTSIRLGLLLALLCSTTFSGCSGERQQRSGVCRRDDAVDCRVSLDGSEPKPVGLHGYACSGVARPDDDARYDEQVPSGVVCASQGANGAAEQTYCCTSYETPCAYDPVADCDVGEGYQCRGSSRPEALNPAIKCGNGVVQEPYINYCCSGQDAVDECLQVNTVGCSDRLLGFTCPLESLPKGEQLGASKSRADYYRPLCSMPSQGANLSRKNYCCFMPALVPPGGSCVQDTLVPGCAPGRFGFACYGPDTPDQDYPPMSCPEPGVRGTSAEGYPATLYCCDFK